MKHRTSKGLAALLLCVLCLTLSLMGCGEKSANEGSTQKAPAGMELETAEQTWSMLTLEEVGQLLDYGPVSVYLWYDDGGCIQKLLVWGETIVWK